MGSEMCIRDRSTALMTLGRAGGYPLAARNGVAALFLEEAAGGGVTRTVTPALERLGALAAQRAARQAGQVSEA